MRSAANGGLLSLRTRQTALLLISSALTLTLTLAATAGARNDAVLQLTQTIPLPQIDGRIDHFAIDVKGQRAFLAALARNTIEVVDLKAGRVICAPCCRSAPVRSAQSPGLRSARRPLCARYRKYPCRACRDGLTTSRSMQSESA